MLAKMKKTLAALLTIVMFVGLLPTGVLAATTSQEQIEGGSSPEYYTYDAVSKTFGNPVTNPVTAYDTGDKVKVSKTIAGTANENEFDITLKVETKQEITHSVTSPDAAAVLVIDTSGSMNDNGGLTAAKKAAIQFAHSFAKSANGAKRQLAVVSFATGAYYEYTWQDVATLTWGATPEASNNAFTRKINSLGAGGGTNMEAGLLVAKNVMAQKTVAKIDHRFVIFLTDGAPTFRMKDDFAKTFTGTTIDARIESNDHYSWFVGENKGDIRGTGSDQVKVNADNAAAVATQIRAMAADTQAKQKVQFLSVAFKSSDSNIYYGRNTNKNEESSTTWKTVSQWLTDISTKAPYSADKADELLGTFDSIIKQIEMMTNAWQVTDPMGEKISFVSGTGVVNDGENQEKIFNTADKTLVWDLTKATAKSESGVYTYQMTYRVRLDNLSAKPDAYYLTNGETTLTYNYTKTETVDGKKVTYVTDDKGDRVFDATTGKVIKGMEKWKENQVAEFKVPKVKSLFAPMTFTKIGHETVNGEHPALTGVGFKVQHSPDCSCGQTAAYSDTAISNSNGVVSFANLPSGHTYVLTETDAPENYESLGAYTAAVAFGALTLKDQNNTAVTNGKIENILSPKNTVFTVNKNWNDNKNAYGTRQNVDFTLMRVVGAKDDAQNKETNDVEAQSLTLTAADKTSATQWSGSFEAVPTVDIETGAALSYYVKETAVDGYKTTVGTLENQTFTVTNTLTDNRTITIRKDWVADSKLLGKIDSVTVLLKQGNALYNGKDVKDGVVTLTKANNWQATITDVPVYSSTNQAKYDYTIEEQGVTNGSVTLGGASFTVSATSGDGTVSNPFVIKNTIAAGSVTINGTKEWKDNSNAYNTRPDSITVSLLADGIETGHSVTLAKDATQNVQSYAFPGTGDAYTLPEYDVTDGHKIVYTVSESGVEAPYQSGIAGYTITNKLVGAVSVSGEKIWNVDDEATQIPKTVTIELLRNGDKINEKTVGTDGDWGYSFSGLDEYNADGAKYTYSVQEKGEKNGSVTIGDITYAVTHEGSDIKNTVTDTTTIAGTKIWVDGNNALNTRPEASAVKIGLYNGSALVTSTTLTVDEEGVYHYQFNNVAVYGSDGKKIDYTVREMSGGSAIENNGEIAFANGNYVVTYGENTITNTIKQEQITVYGKKVWVDGNNAQNTRPASITINLAGGASKQINKAEGTEQSFSFTGLNKFDSAGAVINYTVSEEPVKNYTTAAITGSGAESDPFVITNTYTIPTTKLAVSKTWIDGNRDHSGDSVILQLTRNGSDVKDKTLTLSAENHWGKDEKAPVEFTDLPLFSEDYQTAYSYSVKETNKPDGYTASVNNGNVTNTLDDTKDVTINVQKVWVGPEAARPESIIFNLYRAANGGDPEFVQEITVTPDASGVWSGKAEGLSKTNAGGYEYQYSITEKGMETADGKTTSTYNGLTYDVTIKNFTITNTVQQQNNVTVAGEKLWKNFNGDLPRGVVIDLYADGHRVGTGEDQYSAILPLETTGTDNVAASSWNYSFGNLPKYDLSASGDGHEIVYSVKERGVSEAGTILFGNDHFNVAGGTKADGYKITNTYTSTDVYQYRVEAHYTIILDGKAQPTEDVNIGSFTTEKGTTITKTGSEYVLHNSKTYTFDESNKNNVLSVKVDDPNTTPTLVLNYVLVATTPEPPTPPTPDADSYSLIIHYKEKDTGITLATDVTRFVTEGGSYDVTALTQNEITGYTLDSVTGGKTADSNVYRNVEITVWYVAEEVIDPTKPPLTPDPGKPETPVTPTNPGEEVIEPTNPPLTPNPGELIPDENVPLSGLPHTGGAESIRGLLAVLMSTGTLGLAAGLRRKKDNDSEEDK